MDMSKNNSKNTPYSSDHERMSSPVSHEENSLTLRFQSSFQTPKPPLFSPNLENIQHATFKEGEKFNNQQDLRTHHTLGQMAEQFQERARAFRLKNPASDQSEEDNTYPAEEESDDDHESAGHNESTGRWTKQEHELFLEALKKYGKEWKKVASMVKTRTVVQTRTHAQKYFQKLAKTMGSGDTFPPQDVLEKTEVRQSAQKRIPRRPQDAFISPESHQEANLETRRSEFDQPRSYFPLESEELRPHPTMHSTPTSFQMPSLLIPPPSRQDFPQPSPAACGKRKQAELAAAQILAGSSTLEMEGAHMLSAMKRDNDDVKVDFKKMRPLSLSIAFPEKVIDHESEPGTPWESELRALSSKSHLQPLPVSTPSEQRNVVERIRKLIEKGDIHSLQDLLKAALLASRSEFEHSNDVSPLKLQPPVSAGGSNGSVMSRLLNNPKAGEVPLLIEAVKQSAVEATSVEICRLLIESGASVNLADDKGDTCLHFAAVKGYDKLCKLLLNKGCSANAINEEGNAAVHLAALHGHASTLELLAQLGANFHLRNYQALSPIDLVGQLSHDPGEREVLRRHMFSVEPRLRTLILFHEDFFDHTARRPSDWEGPDRFASIMKKLQNRQVFPDYELEFSSQFDKADVTLLGRVHSPDYLAFVNDLSKKVQSEKSSNDTAVPFTPQVQRHLMRQSSDEIKNSDICDTSFSSGTLNASRRAAGAVAHAVDRVLLGRNRNAFCVVRPPGHHAGYQGLLNGSNSCGFCIFNNVAVGALHALEDHNCERVAIVDLDIHHGNGTEDIVRRFQHPSRLLFFSIHLYDHDQSHQFQFYPGTGGLDDYVHNIINVPITPIWKYPRQSEKRTRPGNNNQTEKDKDLFVQPKKPGGIDSTDSKVAIGREAFRQAIVQRLIPSLRAFNPSLILVSSGFDAADGDVGNCRHQPNTVPVKGMDLKSEDFSWATTEIMKIADICCNGRIVSVLEGGYGEYGAEISSKVATRQSQAATNSEIDAHAVKSLMNRNILAESVAAHVHRLIDPYGPSRISLNNQDLF